MAGDLHDAVIKRCETVVAEQLSDIRRGNNQVAADLAQGVHPRGSIKVESKDGGSHFPDGSWMHDDATELGVILEVSYSQKIQDLPFLADSYILDSNGLTQMVIGVDLEYRKNKGKEARVIVWRPKQTKKKGKTTLETKKTFEGIFRNADGSLADGKRILRIELKDFGNKLDCPGIQKAQGAITISFAQLYEMVRRGEASDQKRKRRRGSDEVLAGGSKKQMVRPAPERLTTQDEERFVAAEEEVDNSAIRMETISQSRITSWAGSEDRACRTNGPIRSD
ncbi:hypothetical protein B0T25DRAFT_99087 [Lasiosphaeria hispida]|uniref:Uncharacterized protein n=1 Tax=Lasiosphaeria hispida TaxID=260671 RepID=A0AAJ0HQ70_9PEZI|nr:hypothetical protein B0T25DRAFT_99087 [Lasiosphaeria hispida]